MERKNKEERKMREGTNIENKGGNRDLKILTLKRYQEASTK